MESLYEDMGPRMLMYLVVYYPKGSDCPAVLPGSSTQNHILVRFLKK